MLVFDIVHKTIPSQNIWVAVEKVSVEKMLIDDCCGGMEPKYCTCMLQI